jgi:hypothetical protein
MSRKKDSALAVSAGLPRLLVTCIVAALSCSAKASTVGYWRFEEGIPNTPARGTGTIIDSSGNGNNGTPFYGPVYSSNVPVSTIPQTGEQDSLSMLFNGTDQRVFIPDSPSLALTQSITLEAYIDPLFVPFTSAEQIVFRGDDRIALDPYSLAIANGELQFEVTNSSNDEADLAVPFTTVNQWSYVAGTLDDATGVMDLYLNGNLVATGTTAIRPYAFLDASQNPGLGIGNVQSSNYNEWFDGYIDEVRISNQALLPNQLLNSIVSIVPEPALPRIVLPWDDGDARRPPTGNGIAAEKRAVSRGSAAGSLLPAFDRHAAPNCERPRRSGFSSGPHRVFRERKTNPLPDPRTPTIPLASLFTPR